MERAVGPERVPKGRILAPLPYWSVAVHGSGVNTKHPFDSEKFNNFLLNKLPKSNIITIGRKFFVYMRRLRYE